MINCTVTRRIIGCLALLSVAFQSPAFDEPEAEEPPQTSPLVETTPVKAAPNIDLKELVTEPLGTEAQRSGMEHDAATADETVEIIEGVADEDVTLSTSSADAPALAAPETTKDIVASDGEGGPEAIDDRAAQQAPLVLLNNEVLPGTAARLAWSPSVSFVGISSPTAVLVVNGLNPGPTVCLTAAIHGDELNGIEVVRRVLYNLNPAELSGAVIGVPIVNLEGFRNESRYLADRRDLNRYFPGNPLGSAASRIAHSFFNEVLSQCNQLIDLHTGSFRRTNLPQLRADLNYPEVEALSRKMGSIVVLQSKGASGSLRRAATENGIPAVTLEAGAPHGLQKSAIEYGVKSVESALSGLGLTKSRSFSWLEDEPVYVRSIWVRTNEGGILLGDVDLGDRVKKGDLLGVVTDPITNRRSEVRSPAAGRIIGMALNQVMHPGFAAYHIGIKASVVDAASDAASDAIGDDGEEAPDAQPSEDTSDEEDYPRSDENDESEGVMELGEDSEA
jgi:hypothetical protein